MQKQINIVPYVDDKEQSSIGLNKDSLVAIMASSESKSTVLYLNLTEKLKEEYDISEFKHFVESFEENDLYDYFPGKSLDSQKEKVENQNYVSISVSGFKMEKDYDEDSRSSWESPVAKVLIVDFYNGGLNKELLEEKAKELKKSVASLGNTVEESASDAQEYQKDPYKYHGVSRRDFY